MDAFFYILLGVALMWINAVSWRIIRALDKIASAVGASRRETQEGIDSMIVCPFCGETYGSLHILKAHLLNSCREFAETLTPLQIAMSKSKTL